MTSADDRRARFRALLPDAWKLPRLDADPWNDEDEGDADAEDDGVEMMRSHSGPTSDGGALQ